MLWLSPPPYLRRLVAATLVVAAVIVDLAGESTVDHPFVTADVAAGAPLEASVIEYRQVPSGLLPPVPEPAGFTVRALRAGEPLTPSSLSAAEPPPEGWWSIPVPLPVGATVGTPVRLVGSDPVIDVEGVVSAQPGESMLGGETEGMVAVPPEGAGTVAAAVGRGEIVVLAGTPPG